MEESDPFCGPKNDNICKTSLSLDYDSFIQWAKSCQHMVHNLFCFQENEMFTITKPHETHTFFSDLKKGYEYWFIQ